MSDEYHVSTNVTPAFPRAGILAALAIPTDASGRLKKHALGRHLQWLRERGVHGVLALGSSGEFPLLSLEQRKAALEAIAELAAPLPVIANISDIRPGIVAELARFANRIGLPGIGIMPPSFYAVSAADQLALFFHAADAAQLPVMLYNFPERTGNRIAAETIAAFAERAPMAAIKQSGREFGYHEELIALGRDKGFVVFSGADTRLPEVFALGAAGCIGGLVNIVPELMVEIYQGCRPGVPEQSASASSSAQDYEKAVPEDVRLAAVRMTEVGTIMERLGFPLNIAAGLEARGFDPGEPKMIVSAESRARHEEVVQALRERFAAWQLEPAGVG